MVHRSERNKLPVGLKRDVVLPLVIFTGVKYSGKSTAIIRTLSEFKKNGLSAVGVDSTGREDYRELVSFNATKIAVLRGEKVFAHTEEGTLLVTLYNKSRAAYFLNQLTSLTNNKLCILCEVDMDDVSSFLATHRGEHQVVLVLEYDFTKLRDTAKQIAIGGETAIHVLVNSRDTIEDASVVEETIKRYIPQVNQVSFISNMTEFVSGLGVV
jgi:molybdopterin-guanine dinucleotide biosynthesis protein